MELLLSNGWVLDESVLAAIVWCGGWEAEAGKRPVMKVYVRRGRDEHMNIHRFGVGKDRTKRDKDRTRRLWPEKLEEYLELGCRPEVGPPNRGSGRLEDVRTVVGMVEVRSLQAAANAAGDVVVGAANADVAIMSLVRCMEDGLGVRAVCRKGGEVLRVLEECVWNLCMTVRMEVRRRWKKKKLGFRMAGHGAGSCEAILVGRRHIDCE